MAIVCQGEIGISGDPVYAEASARGGQIGGQAGYQ